MTGIDIFDRELFKREKAHYSLGRLKKDDEHFEIIVDAGKAALYRDGSLKDVREILRSEKIFSDAKDGSLSGEAALKKSFGTADPLKVAEVILKEGEVQLTSEYRKELCEAKRRQLIDIIHRNAVDPATGLPHPVKRLENAFEEVKVKVDGSRSVEAQIDETLKKLRVVLPVRFEKRKLQVVVPSKYAHKAYALLKSFGRLNRSKWHSDGTLFALLEMPAGAQQDMVDRLNGIAHGDVDIKIVER